MTASPPTPRSSSSRRERLDGFATDYADSLLTREQLLKGTQRVREQSAVLEAELATLGSDEGYVFDFEWFAQTVDELPIDEVRTLIRSVATVTLHRRGKGARALHRGLVEVAPR